MNTNEETSLDEQAAEMPAEWATTAAQVADAGDTAPGAEDAENAAQEAVDEASTPKDRLTHWEEQAQVVDEKLIALNHVVQEVADGEKRKKDREAILEALNELTGAMKHLKEVACLLHDNPDYDSWDLTKAQSTFDLMMRLGIGRHLGDMIRRAAGKVLSSDSVACVSMQVAIERGDCNDELRMKGKLSYSVKTNETFTGLTWKNLYMDADGNFSPDMVGQDKLPLTYDEEAPKEGEEEQTKETETVTVPSGDWTPNQGLEEDEQPTEN